MISAADIYPEFVGEDPAPQAKILLARAAERTPKVVPVASTSRRVDAPAGGSGGSGPSGSGSSPTSTGSLPQNAMKFIPFYVAASAKFGIPWQILASIHKSETGFGDTGSNASANSAGAVGPMQFLPSTWEGYKQDGNGDGKADILNVADAIFGAGALLKANHGTEGPNGLQKAIFAYNHAQSYVDQIIADAKSFGWDGKAGSSSAEGVVATFGAGGVTSGIDAAGAQTVGTAAAFGVVLEGPTREDRLEAMMLQGQKSYMNDEPLIDFIEQLCSASMHHFQSLPDGRFYAFFPDYFGSFNHRAPYWEIDDVEVIDMTMYLSDENLATHVYVVGDTMLAGSAPSPVGPQFVNRLNSNGVVSIFDAFNLNWLTKDKSVFSDPNKFLNRYGVRPYYEDAPYVHAPFFEIFVAFQRFMLLWARQFLTNCEFTFMPEMYPGGRVAFKDRGVVCYVDSVKHEFDYENGFTTTAQLSAPSADVNSKVPYPLGMIRTSTGGSAG